MLSTEFVFGTSFNKRIYDYTKNIAVTQTHKNYPNNILHVYVENSFESKEYNTSIDINEIKLSDNIRITDLFIEYDWLESFLKTSKFSECYKTGEYYNKNSPFWFRKVLAVSSLASSLKDGQYGIWIDADCYIVDKNFPKEFIDYVKENDWLVIYRKNDWIESGFQIIKGNQKTKEFANKYIEYFKSGEVFNNEQYWADNWVLGSLFNKYNMLKTSGLTKEFGSPIDIRNYIVHWKGPLSTVRSNKNI